MQFIPFFILQLTCEMIGLAIWQANSVFKIESKQIKDFARLN